jgi:hypothetical protein
VYFFGGQIILLVRATINRQTIAQRRLQRRPYAAERHQRCEREPPPGRKPADERLVQHGDEIPLAPTQTLREAKVAGLARERAKQRQTLATLPTIQEILTVDGWRQHAVALRIV